MTVHVAAPSARRRPRRTARFSLRSAVYQILAVTAVAGLAAYLVGNAMNALSARGIATGFAYLFQEAGFGIGESPIDFSPSDHYLRALIVGLLNTLKVSALAIVAATVIGLVVGILRLSNNWGAAKLAGGYVELFRNTPQLLQIIFWYYLMTRLPGPRQALQPIDGVFVSNRGLLLPWPADHPAYGWAGLALLLAVLLVMALRWWADRRQIRTGQPTPVLWSTLAILLGLPLAAWWIAGAPTAIDRPVLRGLNFSGGVALSPEFTALFMGLSLYIGAFIAEIVRGGILAIGRGQIDAARALGLARGQIFRLVLLPQALRIIVPPTAAQYVSLAKNSSLAVAIGYPDLVNISNTTINQTGHTIEAIVIMSAVYLLISFTIAALMNWYNRLVALVEH